MKKKLFLGLLAAAAVSFTACQKDQVLSEVPQDNEIGFSTYVGRDAQTKATVTDIDAMKENSYPGIGVFAYFTGTTDYNSSTKPDFMYNQLVKYTSSVWDYNPKKYWPGGTDKVSFFAYAPYNDEALALSLQTATGDPTVTYTQPSTIADQIDLLFATPVENKKEGTVDFTFNHALARVGLKVKTAREDYQVKITNVTLSARYNTKATFSLRDGSKSNITKAADPISYSPTFDATYTNSTTGLEITTNTNKGYMMIIPTDLSADADKVNVSVTYNYQYKYDGTTLSTEESKTQTGTVAVDFQQGKAYTLVLTLDPLSPITFSVTTVNGWDPVTGEDTPVVNNVANN